MIYLQLFWQFFLTGLSAVGGGMATLPFLYRMSDKFGWFSYTDIANMVAVSESTPGPIGVNMATYCGNTTAGVLGGVVATLGLVAPSVIIILIIAAFINDFNSNRHVRDIFYGLRPVAIALIIKAAWQIAAITLFDFSLPGSAALKWKELTLYALMLASVLSFKKIHPLVYIAAGAAVGIILGF